HSHAEKFCSKTVSFESDMLMATKFKKSPKTHSSYMPKTAVSFPNPAALISLFYMLQIVLPQHLT
ncbi:MAG: hypothetical protein RSG57_01865, partial [Christensenellaceae bacterium]